MVAEKILFHLTIIFIVFFVKRVSADTIYIPLCKLLMSTYIDSRLMPLCRINSSPE